MASVTRNRNLRGQVEVETSAACLKVLEPQVDMSTFGNATRHLFPVTSNPVGTFYCPHPVRSQLTWKLGKPAIETPLSRTYRAGQGKGRARFSERTWPALAWRPRKCVSLFILGCVPET